MLWSGAIMGWITYLTRGDVNPMTWTDCRLGHFLFYFFRSYSSALLIIMCIEKFLALYFPLRMKTFCTVKTARLVTGISAIVFVAYNMQNFFVWKKIRNNNEYLGCKFISSPSNYEAIFHRINSTLYSFIPFCTMIITNIAIIYKLVKAKFTNEQVSTDHALSKSAIRGSAMLVTISIMFIILTGPVAIVYVISVQPKPLVYAIISIMQYTNHSINGFLYCIVGSKFRKKLIKTFRCGTNSITDINLANLN